MAATKVQRKLYPVLAAEVGLVTNANSDYPYGDVRRFGADKTGVIDSTTFIQNAITYVLTLAGGELYFPDGTYLITAALVIPFATGWSIRGQSRLGTIIRQQTNNTPIFKFTSDLTHSWRIADMKFDWTNNQPSTNTAACGLYFVGSPSGAARNYFNFMVERVNFANCCDCFGSDSTTRFTLWGYVIRDVTVQGSVTRSVMTVLPSVAAGNPNCRLDRFYISANVMVGPVFSTSASHQSEMHNIEINNALLSPQILVDTGGCDYTIGTIRVEVGTYSGNTFLFDTTNGRLIADSVQLSTMTIDATTGNSCVFRGATVEVREFEFIGAVITGGSYYVIQNAGKIGRIIGSLPANCYLTNIGSSSAADLSEVVEQNVRRVSGNKGDASYAVAIGDPPIIRYQTALTANRTITLPTPTGDSNLFNGLTYTIVREGLGNFRLDVVRNGPTTLDGFPPNTGGIIEFTYLRSSWLVTKRELRNSVSVDNGDAAATLTVGQSSFTQLWNTPLTAARAVTLSTGGLAKAGDRYRIVRGAASTGAFNLNVGTGPLKALTAAGQWCEVEYDGAAWLLSSNGTL